MEFYDACDDTLMRTCHVHDFWTQFCLRLKPSHDRMTSNERFNTFLFRHNSNRIRGSDRPVSGNVTCFRLSSSPGWLNCGNGLRQASLLKIARYEGGRPLVRRWQCHCTGGRDAIPSASLYTRRTVYLLRRPFLPSATTFCLYLGRLACC